MVSLVRATARGLDAVTTAAGGRLLAALLALVGVTNLLVNTFLDGLVVTVLDTEFAASYVATLPVDPGLAAWLLVPCWMLGSWLLVVLVRVAADDRSALDPDHVTREALPATVRTMVLTGGGGALVVAGLAFGIAPGVLLLAHLAFAPVFVAVDDEGLIDAVVGSWRVAAANRVRVLVLATGIVAAGAAVAVGFVLLTLGSPLLEFLAGVVVVSLGVVVAVTAVVDVRTQHERTGVGTGPPAGRHGAGAL